jgi:hypothetical protein
MAGFLLAWNKGCEIVAIQKGAGNRLDQSSSGCEPGGGPDTKDMNKELMPGGKF